MPAPLLQAIPYRSNSLSYFHTIAQQLPMPVLLQSDSNGIEEQRTKRHGRFDIMTAAPDYWLESAGGTHRWAGSHPPPWNPDSSDIFSTLHRLFDEITKHKVDYQAIHELGIPFCGGLVGYCAYDLARQYFSIPSVASKDIDIPDLQFSYFSWAIVQDHHREQAWTIIHPSCPESLRNTVSGLASCSADDGGDFSRTKAANHQAMPRSNLSYTEYLDKIRIIKSYILEGDCYQINFSQRFSTETTLKPIEIYCLCHQALPSPYSAYLPIAGKEGSTILSFSPERFLRLEPDGKAITQPIKGTAARHQDEDADLAAATALVMDPKNIAENLMIVDLLRNDLGKVCMTGSVKTEALFEVQSFPNVHHLVSTVTGQLKRPFNGADLIKACFPGGSITGAPKIRAMQIIEELEPQRRSIYCGLIGYLSAHGLMDTNIAIRTALHHDHRLYCWGGGGIVADSSADSEYQESITKVSRLLQCMGKRISG